ncbi:MAG TPA: hypothetical protein VNP37_15500 [Actinomycetospora sp.]|nr:hypothetical protein [Actinomycetospora sp.]
MSGIRGYGREFRSHGSSRQGPDGPGRRAVAARAGARMFRAHEVAATRRVVDMVSAIRGDRAPVRTVRALA